MPLQEMSWARWQELHPDTKVVSSDTGFGRNYRVYPYGSYDNINSGELLFPMIVDKSRPIKERVLAVRVGDGGPGYPYGELAEFGEVVALNEMVGGVPTAIFFEAQRGGALPLPQRRRGEVHGRFGGVGHPGGQPADRRADVQGPGRFLRRFRPRRFHRRARRQ